MFLKCLKIVVDGKPLRTVPFRRGLNLIVDATPTPTKGAGRDRPGIANEDETRTGNNVGKTTVLRCVDYCVGGKEESLYLDREFGTPNSAVYKFLSEQTPEFVLELEDASKKTTIRLVRKFGQRGGSFNEETLSESAYADALRRRVFKVASAKPTLRELTPKFVRVEDTALKNILRWIPHGKSIQYEAVWLTLFGFSQPQLFEERRTGDRDLDRLKKQEQALRQLSLSPRQERQQVERRIAQLTAQLEGMSLEGAYGGSIDELNTIRAEIGDGNQRLAELEAELGHIQRTLSAITEDAPLIDDADLRELYEDAGRVLDSLHVEYAQLVDFHATLAANKTALVEANHARATAALDVVRSRVNAGLRRESELLRRFADPRVFADVRQLSDQIAKFSQRKGELASAEKLHSQVQDSIQDATQRLALVEQKIASEMENVHRAVDVFNDFFSDFTRMLYGEESVLLLDFVEKKGSGMRAVGEISNLEGHEGTGKKKGLIAAFDLAYLALQDQTASKSARFTLADELEVIDANQLATIFEIAEATNGQFVIPILSDRLSHVAFPRAKDCTVLKLSQNDRFFRIGQNWTQEGSAT